MIAPTNCNPDCDCAQRMVRCQKAVERSVADHSMMYGGTRQREGSGKPMTADELLAAFPATMGVAPGEFEDDPGQRRLRQAKSAENRRRRLVAAFRACELDCGMWSDNALAELADIAIKTLEAS